MSGVVVGILLDIINVLSIIPRKLLGKILLMIKYFFWWAFNKRIPIKVTQTVVFPVIKKEGFLKEDIWDIKEFIKKKHPSFKMENIRLFDDNIELIVVPEKLAGFVLRLSMIDETMKMADIFGEEFSNKQETVVEFATLGHMEFYYRQTDKLETFYEFTELLIEWLRQNKFNNTAPIKNYVIIECKEIIKLKEGVQKRVENKNKTIVFIQSEKGLRLECKEQRPIKVIKAVKKYFTPLAAS